MFRTKSLTTAKLKKNPDHLIREDLGFLKTAKYIVGKHL